MRRIVGAHGFQLTAPGVFSESALPALAAADGEVVVEVAGCGLCHTDVGFAYGGVPTRHPLPLILGHEISGRVVDAGDSATEWLGRDVIVPAVIPCGACDACRANRPTICRKQFMPGNDGHGGFATHVVVPARGLCPVPAVLPRDLTLEMLSVVADAVTTPYEAITRAGVGAEDLVVIVGAGGIGGFAVQIAAAFGATVVAIDIDDERLALAHAYGATLTINPKLVAAKTIRESIRGLARESGRGRTGTKIFEMSGTAAGQQTAFNLLDFGSELAVVGYTADKIEIRLSNLMALDATARGNWGCAPANYPKALALVLEGQVTLEPFVDVRPLAELPELFAAASRHELRCRVILTPAGASPSRARAEMEKATA
ncbi:MAG TPA: 6-hydroxycyclohex-1-ene-1-carbonyl-CoA dehydrogenase [Thermoanaerobaculia bacterium]|nr:6-hydroxycyclohex-1-ene-1-carbonyl-CoA dehydrogenase [Thermoanaerobaculia bacterium]